MKTYGFTILASGVEPNSKEFERIFNVIGGGDYTVALQNGQIVLKFARLGYSMPAAIESATAEVKAAGLTIDRVKQLCTVQQPEEEIDLPIRLNKAS